jgi:hypothetical protein
MEVTKCLKPLVRRPHDHRRAIGEFFFGAEKNPFRRNEVLLPKNWDDLAADDRISETEPAEAET